MRWGLAPVGQLVVAFCNVLAERRGRMQGISLHTSPGGMIDSLLTWRVSSRRLVRAGPSPWGCAQLTSAGTRARAACCGPPTQTAAGYLPVQTAAAHWQGLGPGVVMGVWLGRSGSVRLARVGQHQRAAFARGKHTEQLMIE